MMSCLSALCVLGVVMVGLLLLINVIRSEQAVAALSRGFAALMLVFLAICILKGLAAAVLRALAVAVHCIVIAALVVAALVIVLALIARVARHLPKKKEGDAL